MSPTEQMIILSGCLLSAAAGWTGCYLWRRRMERREADKAWRMATMFHRLKNGDTRL